MDKIAEMVRDAEIRGALAAFVDAGLVKVASQEAFEGLVAAVGNKLGEDDYDLQKVAAVTDEILGEAEKTAAVQDDELIRNAALGELLQMKVAGQIDDETFQKEASQLMSKEADIIGAGVGALRSANLTPDEQQALIKRYGLANDASLALRNAGRGAVGGVLGLLPGTALNMAGIATGNPGLSALGGLGALAGYGAGMYAATNKYSKGNAQRIMAEKNASEDELIRNAALGELLQMKVAGQIDDETFQKEASQLMSKEAYNVRTHKADVQKKRDAARAAMAETKKPRVAPAPAAKPGLSVAKKIGLGAGGLAAAAGTAALGKMLYDKYNANSGTAKVAEEADNQAATNAALGELLQMKVAGQIDDETFQKEANALLRLGGKVRDAIMKAPGAGKAVNALNTAKAGIGNRLNAVTPKQKLMGAAGAGFAAGGLADHLVNKYRNPA